MPYTRSRLPTDSDLAAIEEFTNFSLSGSVRQAYTELAGYEASGIGLSFTVSFPNGTVSDDLLQRFLLVEEIRAQWPHIGYLREFVSLFGLGSGFIEPSVLLPFADCAEGCLYLANSGQHEGRVYYADNGDFGIAFLAESVMDLGHLLNLPTS